MSEKDILKNAERGRYYILKGIAQAYPVPYREPDGRHRIIIENDELHKADVAQYGAYQAQKWVKQGNRAVKKHTKTQAALSSRSKNVIERMKREIRRRTRVVGAFPYGKSALMLVCARLRYISGKDWGTKRYLSMKYLADHGDDFV